MSHPDIPSACVVDMPVSAAEPPQVARLRRPQPVLILFASLICIGIGQTLVFAVLPPAARNLGLSELQVGSIFTVSAVFWMMMSPFWGRRSDFWGRRPLILLGLSGYAVSMTAFAACLQISLAGWLALLPTYLGLIAARAIYGVFGSAAMPAAQAYIADRTAPHQRSSQLALLGAAFAFGTIIGPAVVAALLHFGFVAPFYGAGVLGLLSALLVAFCLPSERSLRLHNKAVPAKLSPADRRVLPFLLAAVTVELLQSITMLAAGFYAMDVLGLDATQSARAVGVMLMGSAGAILLTQLVLIRLLQPSPRTLLRAGALIAMLGFTIVVVSTTQALMFAAITLLGFAFGLLRPGVMAGASLAVGMDEQGGVAGLMNATGGMAVTFAPFIGMSLYQFLPQAPYAFNILLAIGLLLAAFLQPQLRAAGMRAEA
ncbi:MAG TPA: MFS transporter [Gammaproteobacteria bacterium]|nr:MFS transporter [Gammaproteobacteria bacterium]